MKPTPMCEARAGHRNTAGNRQHDKDMEVRT
jgi:hypothetical protein